MTGTAATEVSEFDGIYKLPVAVVPTNRAISRVDNPDVVFRWGGGLSVGGVVWGGGGELSLHGLPTAVVLHGRSFWP
jgi:hypothetical protein